MPRTALRVFGGGWRWGVESEPEIGRGCWVNRQKSATAPCSMARPFDGTHTHPVRRCHTYSLKRINAATNEAAVNWRLDSVISNSNVIKIDNRAALKKKNLLRRLTLDGVAVVVEGRLRDGGGCVRIVTCWRFKISLTWCNLEQLGAIVKWYFVLFIFYFVRVEVWGIDSVDGAG